MQVATPLIKGQVSAPQITDWEICVLHRLTICGTGRSQANSLWYRGVFFIARQKLYTPVAIGRSLLPHKCVSGLVFREAVKQLLKCLRCIHIKALLIHIDKIVGNICCDSVDIFTPLG